MSCEKRFAMVLSWVGFGHIQIAFIDALRLTNRKLRNFSNQIKTKVTVNAYGYDYIHTALVQCSVFSYQRRFPVGLFDLVGNAKASIGE